MQQTKYGDITTAESGIIIHQVNAQGVMGSGVAAALRRRFPVIFTDYSKEIHTGQPSHVTAQHLGKVIMSTVTPELKVCNLVGQQYFGSDGLKYTSYDSIDLGLMRLVDLIETELGQGDATPHIHYPLLGSDRGGACWDVVEQIIEHRLGRFQRTLWLYM